MKGGQGLPGQQKLNVTSVHSNIKKLQREPPCRRGNGGYVDGGKLQLFAVKHAAS